MWEEYYSVLRQLPDWLKKPVPFVTDSLSFFGELGVQTILDLGCGAGRNLICLGKAGFDVVGVDISRSALKKAKAWSKMERIPNATVLRCSMTSLPFVRQAFHAAVSVSVVHHALKENIEKTMEEIRTVLRDDGLFLANILSTRDCRYGSGEKLEKGTFRVMEDFGEKRFEEIHHFFSKREILSLLSGFEKISIEPLRSGVSRPHIYWKVVAIK